MKFSSRISITFNNDWCFLSVSIIESFSLLGTPQRRNIPMSILTLLYSSSLLKNSVYGWELFLLKQMQNTKWPEFVIQQFQEKRNEGGVSSGYTESHFSPSQRRELPCVRLKFLTRDFKSSYAAYVVSKERGSRQFRSPVRWIHVWERLRSSTGKYWF